MEDKLAKALVDFENYYNCSQTVTRQFAEEYGLSKELISKLNAGYGGGLCTGYTCGAIVGAIMILGLKYAKTNPNADDKKDFQQRTLKLINDFAEVHGAFNCHELIGFEAGNDRQKEEAREKGVFKESCPAYIKTAIELVMAFD
ncbi:MAG: C-GCAxxG-C-C family protein [Candidatus Cloacimonetes bacterium]|nr:C-GCAxxG-C-C family protein [Candidatus Cloacimonadota bacterium]MDD3500842.1 C-GCAxxG-C-C family protein [Candidatus Cloacimonadota bacterium]